MPKKNKAGRNGFWQFALEVRQKSSNKTMSNEELQQIAGQKWARMSKEERAPYEDRAILDRNNASSVRVTSDGIPLDLIEQTEQKQKMLTKTMRETVKMQIKTAATAGILPNHVFLILHVNHLFFHSSSDRYFICEISVTPFTIEKGVDMENVFHRIVYPGKLPLGFYGIAQIHSKETHGMIEVVQQGPPFENNTEEVFEDLLAFLKHFQTDKRLPILFTREIMVESARKILNDFATDFGYAEDFSVFNLEYMFYLLRNAAAQQDVWPTESLAYAELIRDIHAYTPGISCKFHELSSSPVYCSRSITIREAYVICDNCTNDMGFAKIPGYHIPADYPTSNTSCTTTTRTLTQVEKEDDEGATADMDTWSVAGSSRQSKNPKNYKFPELGCKRSN